MRLNRIIPTSGEDQQTNGFVVPIWSVHDGWPRDYRPDQVYLTAIAPGAHKGPHLHLVRRGLFTCIKGDVLIVARLNGYQYLEQWTGEKHEYASIPVECGIPAAIYNPGKETALVINMPSPAWKADDPDEHPVENWTYEPRAAH